ncbi:hypothetical protein [Microbispora sp. NPDC049125]|uniref:hypothetical protein n=1 Tax=Microbispora sp. NPDC049125 TaxID=3154929 RepID=UPI00346548E5
MNEQKKGCCGGRDDECAGEQGPVRMVRLLYRGVPVLEETAMEDSCLARTASGDCVRVQKGDTLVAGACGRAEPAAADPHTGRRPVDLADTQPLTRV